MPLLTLHPTGPWPSLGRAQSSAQILHSSLPSFTLQLPSKRQLQEASVGRRELGQKPQEDAPAKKQSLEHLSLLWTNT